MELIHERCVSRLCVIGLVMFFGAPGCGDDEGESMGGVSEPDAGGDEASGRAGGSGRASAGRSGRGGAGASGASGENGGAADGGGGPAGASGAGNGGGVGGAGGSIAAAGSGAGESEDDAGTVGEGEAGSGGAGEAGSGGTGEAGSGGAGEAGSGGAGDAGSGGTGEAERCGTRGGVVCSDAQFCNFEPDSACGANDAGGVCEDKPEVCPDIYAPVCGCDNRTYGNECDAHANAASSKREGLCTPEECSDVGGRPVYSDGASTPECMPGEESWTISGGIEPVICCLGEKPQGETCGGIANLQCGDAEFCNYEEAAGGQGCDGTIADAGGVCEGRPMFCTREYNPVCGCDHRTYSNACEAHSSGESILHENGCNENDCEAVNGRVVYGIGPAPMCDPREEEYTSVIDSSGAIPIEGAICCVEP